MPKLEKYKSQTNQQHQEHLSAQLQHELRRHIASINTYPPLSTNWYKMTDNLQHIASIAQMEEDVPSDSKQTLWERDQLTLRYLLEEGKLNLCLRALVSHIELKRQLRAYPQVLPDKARELVCDVRVLSSRLHTFEVSMGLLLKCAFHTVEALQTLDLPQLIHHIGSVLLDIHDHPTILSQAEDKHRIQESMVVHYAAGIFSHLDKLQEDRIMSLMAEQQIIPLLMHLLTKHLQDLNDDTILAWSKCINRCIDTDAFDADPKRFLPSPEYNVAIVKVYDNYIKKIAEQPENRRDFQPLTQFVARERLRIPN